MKIKAFAQVGLMKKPSWLRGELVSRDQENATVVVAGNTLVLENHKVKEWTALEWIMGDDHTSRCKELEDFQDQNWEDLKIQCERMVSKFVPDVVLKFDEKEKTISVGDHIQIMAGVVEKESIVRFFEVPAWTITQFEERYYGRLQPPDVDEIDLGSSQSNLGTARLLVESIMRNSLDEYCQVIMDDQFAREYDN